MKQAIGLMTVLLVCGTSLLAQPQFRNAGAILLSDANNNRVVESGERIRVSLALKNIGDQVASNLTAILQTDGGVSDPVLGTNSYGVVVPCAPSVARDFEFKCTAPSNSLLTIKLKLEDSGIALEPPVAFRFRVGGGVVSASNPQTITINSAGIATPYPSVLTFTGAVGIIGNVSVTLSNLSHTFPDDLDILLVSPGGDMVLLMSDACGNVDLENVTLTFTDDAQAVLPDAGLPNPRTVRPTNYGTPDVIPAPAPAGPYAGVMSAFNAKEAYGDWKLYIVDDGTGDSGAVNDGWSVTITTLQPFDPAPTLKFLGSTNNTIRFSVSGRPGYPYMIESSPDPVQSIPLEAFKMPASGTQVFEYPLGSENKFFRAATDP